VLTTRKMEALGKAWAGKLYSHIEGPDHAELTEMLDACIVPKRRQRPRQYGSLLSVGAQHVVLLEAVEHGERGTAGQRVARIGVRMQEAARDVVIEKGVVDRVARHHQREWQIAAADALGKTDEVRPDGWPAWQRGLLECKEGPRAPAADRDFIGDQVNRELVAQFANGTQVGRVVHCHAGRPLHQRFDDDGGDVLMA